MANRKKFLTFLLLGLPLTLAAAEADPAIEEEVSRPAVQSPLQFGLDIKYVFPRYPDFRWNGTDGVAGRGYSLQLALEWIPFGNQPFGKPSLGLSLSPVYYRNVAGAGPSTSFLAWPATAYVGYRADFFRNQVLVPFAKAGRGLTWFRLSPASGAYPSPDRYDSWEYAFGIELLMDAVDPKSAQQLDMSTGINNTYLVVEYGRSVPARGAAQADLGREEIHVGLRFEM